MADLSFSEKMKLDKLLGMSGGYVLGFSNRTFEAFIADSTEKNIYDQKYENGSGSKANRLRAFWDLEPNGVVGKLISDLLEHRKSFGSEDDETTERLHQACCRIAQRLVAATEPDNQATAKKVESGSAQAPIVTTPQSVDDTPQRISLSDNTGRASELVAANHSESQKDVPADRILGDVKTATHDRSETLHEAYNAFRDVKWRQSLDPSGVANYLDEVAREASELVRIWRQIVSDFSHGRTELTPEEFTQLCRLRGLGPSPNAPHFYRLLSFHERVSGRQFFANALASAHVPLTRALERTIRSRGYAVKFVDVLIQTGLAGPAAGSDFDALLRQISALVDELEKEAAAIHVLAIEVRTLPTHETSTTTASLGNSVTTPRQADVLLVTVNPHETRELLRTFGEATGVPVVPVSIEDRVYRFVGTINGSKIFHALSEMGSGGPGAAQQTVDKAIRALSPSAVIAVGIAFGVNEKKQAIGDILLSRQLHLYDLQRVGGEIVLRGDKPHASTRLINLFEGVAQTTWSGRPVRPGVILTGEKLVDGLNYRARLMKLESEAVGGEMEGAGLYVASHEHKVDWIVIKAICDWGDGHKSKNKKMRQLKAARSASEFLLHGLQQVRIAWDRRK